MNRSSQQLAQLIRQVSRLQRGKLSPAWWATLGVLVIGYLVAAPWLNASLGWNLPVLTDSGPAGLPQQESNRPVDPSADHSDKKRVPGQSAADARVIGDILASQSNADYQSPAGLRYTRGSRHGHRLRHLMAHAEDQPNRPGQHGVFDETEALRVVGLVDEAYQQAIRGQRTMTDQEGDRTVYNVELGRRIGYIGGESGNRRGRPAAQHIRIVVEGKDFVTAFPYRP